MCTSVYKLAFIQLLWSRDWTGVSRWGSGGGSQVWTEVWGPQVGLGWREVRHWSPGSVWRGAERSQSTWSASSISAKTQELQSTHQRPSQTEEVSEVQTHSGRVENGFQHLHFIYSSNQEPQKHCSRCRVTRFIYLSTLSTAASIGGVQKQFKDTHVFVCNTVTHSDWRTSWGIWMK